MNIEKYFTSMEHLLNVFDRRSRSMGFNAASPADFFQWKSNLREKLAEITGMNQMEYSDLKPRLLESHQLDGFRRDKMIIQTEPDVWMPFYVLIPDQVTAGIRTPCIIAAHGHDSGGKWSVGGRTDIPAVVRQIKLYNYEYGVRFAREGYIVFCPDARAFGERREWTKQGNEEEMLLGSSCAQLNHMAICLGQSVTGMWTWDLMRLADYIQSREDSGDIACAGLSGGGLQTLWFAAIDDRVKCAIVSGYFYGYKDSLLRQSNHCACNYVPNIWNMIDMGDLGALIAPKALLIETGILDPLNGERGLANVTEQLAITSQAYRLLGAEERLRHYIFDGGHRWDGGFAYQFTNHIMQNRGRVEY